MNHTCPHCGTISIIQSPLALAGAKARWQGSTKAERSKAASDAAVARWAKKKKKPIL